MECAATYDTEPVGPDILGVFFVGLGSDVEACDHTIGENTKTADAVVLLLSDGMLHGRVVLFEDVSLLGEFLELGRGDRTKGF